MELADFVSLTGVATIALPLIGAIVSSKNTIDYIIVTLVLIGVVIGSKLLKQIIKDPRPKGAMNCNIRNGGGSAEGEYGMPSEHMAVSSFMIFSTLLIGTNSAILWGAGFIWLAAIGWARYVKHCHSLAQVLGGIVYGGGAAAVLQFILKNLL